jgi:hypothetical protein
MHPGVVSNRGTVLGAHGVLGLAITLDASLADA